ncbi:hypothetical protein K0M31_000245 [Melipona bicolor]|uniref:Uncharacterized protein n=1 Tax=Melipona bicolor TaxID=60889 RepID=A0AA40GD42_9HYME|nr:hypothetical protein K0M31_000245 [Melipona bicolor]
MYFKMYVCRQTWRKEAHLVCKEQSIIQRNHPERNIIRKFSGKNVNQQLLDLCLCSFKIKLALRTSTQGMI